MLPWSLLHLLLALPVPGPLCLSVELLSSLKIWPFVPLTIQDPSPLPLCPRFLSHLSLPSARPGVITFFFGLWSLLLLFLTPSVFCPSSPLLCSLFSFFFLVFLLLLTLCSTPPSSCHPLPSSLCTPLSAFLVHNFLSSPPLRLSPPPSPFPTPTPCPLPSRGGQDWRA